MTESDQKVIRTLKMLGGWKLGFGIELLKVVYTQFILHLHNEVTIMYKAVLQLNGRLALEKPFLLVDWSLQSI